MNIKKIEIINEFENFYRITGSNSIIICGDLGLDASETKKFKTSSWELGKLSSVKNTLFRYFLRKNEISSSIELSKNNMVIFTNDPLKTINSIDTFIKKNKSKKIKIRGAFLEKHYFNEEKATGLARYSSFQSLQANTFFTLQSPMIILLKILSLAVAEKN